MCWKALLGLQQRAYGRQAIQCLAICALLLLESSCSTEEAQCPRQSVDVDIIPTEALGNVGHARTRTPNYVR